MEGSDQKFVTLRHLDLRSTGTYRCEVWIILQVILIVYIFNKIIHCPSKNKVSAEGPSFSSVHGEGMMTVIRKKCLILTCSSLQSTFLAQEKQYYLYSTILNS